MSETHGYPPCPNCGSNHVVRNGSIHSGKRKYKCKSCNRQFVENPTKKYIDEPTKQIIENLLLEKIPLRGIRRALGISWDYCRIG